MKCVTSMMDIVELDRQFWEITKGLHAPLVPGSILRINERYLRQWGIQVTEENREQLKDHSRYFFVKDELEVGSRMMDADLLLTTETRTDIETQMASTMGNIAATIASAIMPTTDKLAICDFGARRGMATTYTIGEMKKTEDGDGLIGATVFHLIESSAMRAESLARKLSMLGVDWLVHSVENMPAIDTETLLSSVEPESLDIILSLSSMHHHAFPDYMRDMNRALKPGGVLISGDWYSHAWQRPDFAAYMLDMLGVDGWRIDRFRKFFGIPEDRKVSVRSDPNLTTNPDIFAICHQFDYWREIREKMERLQCAGKKPMRRYFLGAHTTLEERKADLRGSGFVVDMSEIRKAFPQIRPTLPARMIQNSNFAVVMVAVKPQSK